MTTRLVTVCFLTAVPLLVGGCGRGGPLAVLGGTPARTPTFDYAKDAGSGCGDLFFFKGTADRREVLWGSADKDKLKLPKTGSKSFDLAAAHDGLEVAVDLWVAAPRDSAYCNDISADTEREATWRATKGKVTITIHGPPDEKNRTYKASIRLEGVVFDDGAGHTVTLADETIREVLVGWYAG